MVFLMTIQGIISLLFLILGWAILKKEAYGIISGFATRPTEEQNQLIANGFPQKVGKLFLFTGIGMIILFPLTFTTIAYAIEVQFGFMLLSLLGGLVYLSKYEIPHKRKSTFTMNITIFIVVITGISILYSFGYRDNELIVKEDRFEITGMYGDEWKIADIKKLELLEEMPAIKNKQNGFGTGTIAKGVFSVEDYGSSLLFIKKGISPILYIQVGDKDIFINGKNGGFSEEWYVQLKRKIEQ
ncbi:DUF3784 domain-containing protein [Pseudoneobacillus sp. C159]